MLTKRKKSPLLSVNAKNCWFTAPQLHLCNHAACLLDFIEERATCVKLFTLVPSSPTTPIHRLAHTSPSKSRSCVQCKHSESPCIVLPGQPRPKPDIPTIHLAVGPRPLSELDPPFHISFSSNVMDNKERGSRFFKLTPQGDWGGGWLWVSFSSLLLFSYVAMEMCFNPDT